MTAVTQDFLAGQGLGPSAAERGLRKDMSMRGSLLEFHAQPSIALPCQASACVPSVLHAGQSPVKWCGAGPCGSALTGPGF